MRKFKDKSNKDQAGAPEAAFIEKVIHINRVAKVVKGGRNFSFNALVVVGDGKGRVGFGLGKAREVVDAIEKGTDNARRSMKPYPIVRNTLPHSIVGRFGAGKVVIKPATPGTGIIAGGSARAVMECLGVSDVFCKSIGTNNHVNVLRATFNGLEKLYSARMMAKKRGMPVARVFSLHPIPVKEVINA
ncbi:30S ribosomal protein S5 [bacterium]|nr:30S ribosomal protein S5 [bacterium]